MFGYFLLKAGMILVFQTSASSLRQLSMVSVCAEAAPAKAMVRAAKDAVATRRPAWRRTVVLWWDLILVLPPSSWRHRQAPHEGSPFVPCTSSCFLGIRRSGDCYPRKTADK